MVLAETPFNCIVVSLSPWERAAVSFPCADGAPASSCEPPWGPRAPARFAPARCGWRLALFSLLWNRLQPGSGVLVFQVR